MATRQRGGPSRRTLLGTGLFGAAGAVVFGSTSAAAAPSTPNLGLRRISDTQSSDILTNAPVKHAQQKWGAVEKSGLHQYGSGKDRVIVLEHTNGKSISFIEPSPTAASPLITLEQVQSHFAVFDEAGAPFLNITYRDGKFAATPAKPEAPNSRIGACVVICLAFDSSNDSASCLNNCISCATGPTGVLGAIYCSFCLVCAGSKAYNCVRHCR